MTARQAGLRRFALGWAGRLALAVVAVGWGFAALAQSAPPKPIGFSVTLVEKRANLQAQVPSSTTVTRWDYRQRTGSNGNWGSWQNIVSSSWLLVATVSILERGKTYGFQVRAVNNAGEGPESDTEEVSVPAVAPPKPSSFTATAGDRQVTLSASIDTDGGSEITRWQYQRKTGSNGSYGKWKNIASSNAKTSISTVVTGLTNGTAYGFKIRAENGAGRGGEAESGMVTPATTPAKPTGLTVSGGNGTVSLSWTAGSNGGSAITGWKYIKHSNNAWDSGWTAMLNSGASTTSYTVPSLTNGTGYKFKVRAVNANGDGAKSDESGEVTPSASAPVTLTASGVTATAAKLAIANWSGAWSYKDGHKGHYIGCTNVAAGTGEASLSGLTPGWDYLVYAYDTHDCPVNDNTWPRAPSVIFTTLLPKVEGVSVTAGGGSLTVGWTAQSYTTGSTGYHVQWKSGNQDWSSDRQSDAATNAAAISNLTGGVAYTVRVRSYHRGYQDRIKYGEWSDPATGAAQTQAVTLTASDVEHDSATLTIANHTGDWYYKANAAPHASCSSSVSGTTTASLAGLSGNTSYTYTAYSDGGCSSKLAAAGAFLTKPGKPETPTVASGAGSGKITLSSSVTGGGTLTQWEYKWKEAVGSSVSDWAVIPSTSTTLNYTVDGLTDGTTYKFKVRAVNASGNGVKSDESAEATPSAATPGMPPAGSSATVPAGPSRPAAIAGNASVSLSWSPGDDGGSAVTGWQYATSEDGYGSWKDLAADGTDTLTATVTDLTNGTEYRFRVRAVNAVGAGAASEESNAATPTARKPDAPDAPALTAGDRRLGVSWTAPADNGAPIAGYDVRYRARTGGGWTLHPHAGTATAATVAGLTNGATYEVQVRASNSAGAGEWSRSATGTPLLPAAYRERLKRLNVALAPEAARALASAAARAVSGRLERLVSGTDAPPPPARALAGLLERHGEGLADGTVPLREALAGASVSLPLAAAEAGGRAGGAGPGFWASGDWRGLSGGGALRRDGRMAALHLGADVSPRRGWFAGMALSVSEAAFDYADRNGGRPGTGGWTARMTGVHPYAARTWDGGSLLWAKAGLSTGEVEIDDGEAGRQSSDGGLASLAAGGSLRLLRPSAGLPSLDLKGEALAARIEIEDNGDLVKAVDAGVHRLRVAVAGGAAVEAGPGAVLTPSAELGLRRDGGDGETGLGVELGGGLSYAVPAEGLVVDAKARTLLAHEGEREEWGASGGLRLDPGARGRGPSLGLRLAVGDAEGKAARLWEEGAAAFGGDGGARPRARVEAEGGYGLPAPAAPGLLLTPYAGLGLEDGGARRYGMGLRLERGPAASLDLEGAHTETPDGRPGQDAMLKLNLRW